MAFGERKQLGVAPHIEIAAGQIFSSSGFPEGVVIVGHFEGRETFFAEGTRFIAPALSTFTTPQFIEFRHSRYLFTESDEPEVRLCIWGAAGG
jgi:hypothetical protein